MKDLYRRLGIAPYTSDERTIRGALTGAEEADRIDVEAVLLITPRRNVYDRIHRAATTIGRLRAAFGINSTDYWSSLDFSDFTYQPYSGGPKSVNPDSITRSVGDVIEAIGRGIAFIWNIIVGGAMVAMFGAIIIVVGLSFIRESQDSPERKAAPAEPTIELPGIPTQPLPHTGFGVDFVQPPKAWSAGSIEIITSASGLHTWVKVAKASTDQAIATRFVRSGERVRIQLHPGIYVLKTASGKTWYGDKELFGPNTQFSIADSDFPINQAGDGWTVELIPQVDGNLSQSEISRSQF